MLASTRDISTVSCVNLSLAILYLADELGPSLRVSNLVMARYHCRKSCLLSEKQPRCLSVTITYQAGGEC